MGGWVSVGSSRGLLDCDLVWPWNWSPVEALLNSWRSCSLLSLFAWLFHLSFILPLFTKSVSMSFLSNSIVSCLSPQPTVGDMRALGNSFTRLFQLLASPPLVSGSLSLLHCGLSPLFLLHRGGDILETELSSRKVSPAEYVQLDLNTDNTLQSTHYRQHTTINTLQSTHYN